MKEIEIISLFDNKIGVSGEETGTDWGRLFFFFFFFFVENLLWPLSGAISLGCL